MKAKLHLCSHCRRNFKYRVSEDTGLYAHWVDNFYLIDVVLLLGVDSRVLPVLFREVYQV
jgi:hypothetical protein